jgi:hypothetical protein
MKRHYWTGLCREERVKALPEITRILDQYAIILNFQLFSDVSMSLVLELEGCNLSPLFLGLSNIMSVELGETVFTHSKADHILLMNITFTKGTGNMEIEVPAIPG